MKKPVSQSAHDASTTTEVPPSHSGARVRSTRQSTTGTPRWVKVSVAIIIVLVLLFVILHLTGHGFGDHMHMSILEHGRQPL